jgi:cytochrome c peroxidase
MFKVPALRNVDKTFPYYHDGSVADLNEAIVIMAKVQLNKELTDVEIKNIGEFLKSLTGEVPKEALN